MLVVSEMCGVWEQGLDVNLGLISCASEEQRGAQPTCSRDPRTAEGTHRPSRTDATMSLATAQWNVHDANGPKYGQCLPQIQRALATVLLSSVRQVFVDWLCKSALL